MKPISIIDGIAYRLRPVELRDAQFITSLRLQDKERNRYINPISEDHAIQTAWIQRYLSLSDDFYFVVENKLTGLGEGLIGIYNLENGTAEWGRWVTLKGSLAATESVDLMFRFAFEKIGLREIYCRTIVENQPVVAFHDSLPQPRRGVLKAHSTIEGISYDVVEHYTSFEHYSNTLAPKLASRGIQIYQRNFAQLLGKHSFHHIGVACTNMDSEFRNFAMLGYSCESELFEDQNQGIRGLFITAPGQPRLELLENLPGSTTLNTWLERKVKMYHFGYQIPNIEKAIKALNECRIRTVSPPKVSSYFGKRIAFLSLPNMFLIELIEA